jgi:hypothetical protein
MLSKLDVALAEAAAAVLGTRCPGEGPMDWTVWISGDRELTRAADILKMMVLREQSGSITEYADSGHKVEFSSRRNSTTLTLRRG